MPHQAREGGLVGGCGTAGAASGGLPCQRSLSGELELDLAPFEFEGSGDGAADGALALVLEVVADDVFFP